MPASAAECVDVAGHYQFTESGTITCTVDGQTATDSFFDAGEIDLEQRGCQVSYRLGEGDFLRRGDLVGTDLALAGAAVVPEPGDVLTRNEVLAVGQVIGPLEIRGTATGAIEGRSEGVAFACTLASRFRFTRPAAPGGGRLTFQATRPDFGRVVASRDDVDGLAYHAYAFVDIRNVGPGPVQVYDTTSTNASDFVVRSGCAAVLAPGEFCSVSMEFHPRVPGARTTSIIVRSTGVDSPQAVTMTGTGVPSPADLVSFDGLWWATNGVEPGWGMNIAHHGEILFATWFTYDPQGRPWWLSLTARRNEQSAYVFAGDLYETRGPPLGASPFRPEDVSARRVGTAYFDFFHEQGGRFVYRIDGTPERIKNIGRQAFGPWPDCVFGDAADPVAATNYQGLWWAAPAGVESGWGVNFAHQGDTMFATWFTYGRDGAPLWLSATLKPRGERAFAGTLYVTSGPAFDAEPFDPARVHATPVGELTVAFADGNHATFGYSVSLPGQPTITQSKAITREVLRAPGTVCH